MTGRDSPVIAGPSKPNRLAREVSPYLQQHAQNPVDWYPWGAEAFNRARDEEKPIFLSIGYSTCHWCHVMERESFSDPTVADLLNSHFICIKVDREERPDIDNLYMNAAIALTGSGGWPLNMVLTPDLRPFFAATYIPRENRAGMPGMIEILPKVTEFWQQNREKAVEAAGRLVWAVVGSQEIRPGRKARNGGADAIHKDLLIKYDSLNGGFGPAPKFPMPHIHLFLLRYWKWKKSPKAREMAEKTLLSMARGGIYDQIGNGFHRYSTDARWLVPHFEKMLYDQALAGMAYIEAYLATRNEEFRDTARGCMQYILSSLSAPGGGFFSAEDADSEGEEGRYYLWTRDELASLLDPEVARVAFLVYPVSRNGNFIDPMTGGYSGRNILHRTHNAGSAARALRMDREEVAEYLEIMRTTLLHARERRVRPFRDEKVLADWNGLAIGALAKVARGLGQSEYIDAAKKAADFVLTRMRKDDGGLYHRYRGGIAGIQGMSADYAFMVYGLLELFFATRDPSYLESALTLEEYHADHFWDQKSGGYFTTAEHATDLFVRQKEFTDGAIPSSNSFSYNNLVYLGFLTGDPVLNRRAEALLRCYSPLVERSPGSCAMFMAGYVVSAAPPAGVMVTGRRDHPSFREMEALLDSHYLPFTLPVSIDEGDGNAHLARIAPVTSVYHSVEGNTTAYVCTTRSCLTPVHSARDLSELLGIGDDPLK